MASLVPPNTFSPAAASSGFSLVKFGKKQQQPLGSLKIGSSRLNFTARGDAYFLKFGLPKRKLCLLRDASKESCKMIRELKDHEKQRLDENKCDQDPFKELKHRFLSFKKKQCLENMVHYRSLAEGQAPKFMVIACADSRVCPSRVLGLQPGEAFTVRNVANLVPPFQHGASETSAALEFAVNSLEVANVLVVGHSRCGGIRALMGMEDQGDSSFIRDWVSIAKSARLSTKAAAGNLSFEKQCTHCEKTCVLVRMLHTDKKRGSLKSTSSSIFMQICVQSTLESLNGSLLNLLTYPWIERRVSDGTLSLHGGYYDFVNCTFEKWTLIYREGLEGGSKYAIKNRSFWT